MNYQIYYEMKEYEDHMDKTLIQVPLVGGSYKKTFFDPILGRVKSVYCSAEDVVVNYYAPSPDEATRLTHQLYMQRNDLRTRVVMGMFDENAWDLPNTGIDLAHSSIRQAKDETQGLNEPEDTYGRPRLILEQHRSWDLNGDGITEPYVITVDKETEKVLRITSREALTSSQRKYTVDYFTYFPFFPNPEGSMALGFGTLLRELNFAANGIVNEVIDAGTLANIQGGFISKMSGTKGKISLKAGEFKEINTYIEDLRKAIFTFDFKGPNDTLYAVLGLLYEYSKLVSSISETMTGQLPASDTPASTVLALIEEGRKVFSSIHKRIHRSFKKELEKIYRLNSLFLSEEKYFRAIGPGNIPDQEEMTVGRKDFADTYDIFPVSDPEITSRAEKIMKSQAKLEDLRLDPTGVNPEAYIKIRQEHFKLLGEDDAELIFQPPPPPPDLPPEKENAEMLAERPVQPLEHQDHLNHIRVIDELFAGPFADEITPTARKLLEQHRREHVSMLYLAEKGVPSGTGQA
jgi:hypothetical protein